MDCGLKKFSVGALEAEPVLLRAGQHSRSRCLLWEGVGAKAGSVLTEHSEYRLHPPPQMVMGNKAGTSYVHRGPTHLFPTLLSGETKLCDRKSVWSYGL